jgi:hypothetical protein
MNSNRKTARVAGILFIFATVVGLLSNIAFLKPILDAPDYLGRIFAGQNQILIGSLLHIISSFACAGIAIALYPVLRKYNEGLALGSVGFRVAETILYVFGSIGVLMLLPLGQEFIKAGMPATSYFQTLANSLLSMRDLTGILAVITFGPGALMYYAIFYKSKLIPRWLSGWGLIAAALCLISGILVMFNIIEFFTPVQIAINIPIALQEMVLAVWLIAKGFNLNATSTGAVKQI